MAIYQYKEIKTVHLELTSKCNAGCPMCARSINGGILNSRLPLNELSLADVQKIFRPEFVQQLSRIYLCGNYGDPIMAQDCLTSLEYLKSTNPLIQLGIHTNGGARPVAFWQGLAKTIDYCRFGIDGLRDTNHLYRQYVNWDSLERNVRSYIDAGGYAEWDYLVFKHNEHQVEEARELAKIWGVKKFNVKSTSRFFSSKSMEVRPKSPVYNKKNEHTHDLEPTSVSEFENHFYAEQKNIADKFGSISNYWDKTAITCRVSQERSLYITAQGLVFPCCWVGNEVYSKHIHSSENQVLQIIETLPEKEKSLSALEKGLEAVVNGPLFSSIIEESWSKSSINEGKLKVCSKTCGNGLKPFENQFL